jgi:hypothetical protein
VLHSYRAKQPPPHGTGLPQLRAITRTGRYQASAEALGARMR